MGISFCGWSASVRTTLVVFFKIFLTVAGLLRNRVLFIFYGLLRFGGDVSQCGLLAHVVHFDRDTALRTAFVVLHLLGLSHRRVNIHDV